MCTVVVVVYFTRGTMDGVEIIKDSRRIPFRSGCPGKSRGRICRSVYCSQNIGNDSSMERPQFAAKSLLITNVLRKVML